MKVENRRYPVLVGARFTEKEKAALGVAATMDTITLNELVRRAVLPAVRRTLDRGLGALMEESS